MASLPVRAHAVAPLSSCAVGTLQDSRFDYLVEKHTPKSMYVATGVRSTRERGVAWCQRQRAVQLLGGGTARPRLSVCCVWRLLRKFRGCLARAAVRSSTSDTLSEPSFGVSVVLSSQGRTGGHGDAVCAVVGARTTDVFCPSVVTARDAYSPHVHCRRRRYIFAAVLASCARH